MGAARCSREALAIHERRFYDRRLTAQSVDAGLVELAVELEQRLAGDDPVDAQVVLVGRGLDGLRQALLRRSQVLSDLDVRFSIVRIFAGSRSATLTR